MFSCAIKPVIMLIQLIKHFAESQQCFPTVSCIKREKYAKVWFSNDQNTPNKTYQYLHGHYNDKGYMNK